MANDFFQFKQFLIRQEKSKMRVTTEGCILGAYAEVTDGYVLDIGTGTGLLALMVAQRSRGIIDAVDIDQPSADEARENVSDHSFKSQITVYQDDIRLFSQKINKKYDQILCNPPFYNNHLINPQSVKTTALHEQTLNQSELAEIAGSLLKSTGQFTVLYPTYEAEKFRSLASERNLHLRKRLSIFNRSEDTHPFRVIQSFGFSAGQTIEDSLIIRDQGGDYTAEFIQLMKPYYLHF